MIWKRQQSFTRKPSVFCRNANGQVRDHTSRHLTDRTIDLALIKYGREDSAESRAAGLEPCIHHFGIEVDDMK